ncbi:type VII secretion protein EccC [Nocardiopsis terrae]|uniref:S-DNA-T family DNA segregation ATPase FtsK/SpoIIIE n=1 Tax=Nocardiopsis terrae TaxID=372655 RepID=A0ABR9HNT2_9ACTN|nr:type VII secretion protein EccCa [Nocardiopsis terrae]MBE1460649.1 S-DNA-T family DNA segregation ATPase FtsK/SpoIIIE [Nocardiopsis terrae]GHC72648.1 type VII secretion protein EccC [Nocardiopsis terrae]
MTLRVVHRPTRTTHPAPEQEPREVEAPPTLPDGKSQGNPLMTVLPLVGMMASLSIMMVMRNPAFMALGAVMLCVALLGAALMLFSRRGQVGRQRRNQRELYLQYLEELRETLNEWEHETRAHARLIDPPPEALYDVLRDPRRLWERRRRHADFLKVRVGTGMARGHRLNLAEQGTALTPTDPFMQSEAEAVIRRFETIPDMPFTLPLDMTGNVSVVGEREDVMSLVRAMIAQFGVFHAPEDAGIAVSYPEENADDWPWLLWFPQVLDPQRREAGVAARMIAPTPRELGILLSDELRSRSDFASEVRRGMGRREAYQTLRRLLVIHDTHGEVATELVRPDHTVDPAALGVTVLHLVSRQIDEPGDVNIRVTVKGGEVVVEDLRPTDPVVTSGTLDDVSPATLTGLARMLAPLRLSPESVEETAQEGGRVDFPAMMGVRDPGNMDVQRLWAPRSERAFLRVPIGVDEMGQPLVLDLKESAQLGMGPHGLCVGATGSGKSEMLRTLVLALAASHPPERVSMVLVDYKGGATFAPFEDMPHVAGMITNLEDDAALIERVHASLSGEVQRRQQMLRDAGNVPSIGDYAHKREQDPNLPPMPHLLVIIDEFGELLTARPDFIELFLSIGRIGRSIGVHLLLSSQRIEGGKLRGLDTYLSYRLGLRTFSEEESRTVLNTPDAFHLPSLPGFGYLKVDTTVYQRFKAGYVSGAYRGPVVEEEDDEGRTPSPRPYTAYNPPPEEEAERNEPDEGSGMPSRTTGPTLLDVLVNQLGRHGEPTRSVWLPPLPSATTLDEVAGAPEETERGLRLPGERPALHVPIGLLDDATRQWQGEWLLDLTASGGHVAVIGGPQSGKTTLLRTLVLSLSLTHTPEQVSVYCLDLLGGGLQSLSGLPHVGGVAVRTDVERVRRTIEEVRGMLEHREEVFRERGIDSVEQLRRRHARGEVPELASADVVLCVDGYGSLRKDFEEVEAVVNELLQRGGGYGIHIVGAMLRWNDVRMAAQSNFGQRVELHLNTPGDSSIARKLAETIKEDASGRALTSSKLFAQTCLPRFDGVPSTENLGEVTEHAVRAVDRAWKGPRAPEVRILPHLLSVRALPDREEAPATVPIGLDERALRPVQLDLFERDQNLLVLGDGESGKSNLLRMISEGFAERYSPKEVVFAIMDPRRSLRDLVPKDYVGGYATTPRVCNGLATGVAKELEARIPQDGGAEDLEPGSFSGPRVIVIADDYDVLTTAGQKPLAPFVPYVSNGRDIGLHFVIARRVAGANRGMYDPLLQSMREVGSSTLLMSGDRGEGQIFPRVYATPLPPGRGRWMPRGGAPRLIQTAIRDQA